MAFISVTQDEHDEDKGEDKGHKVHKPEAHWWDHLWPFMMLTAACLGGKHRC